jgi:uncharacterized protein involved in response to NO
MSTSAAQIRAYAGPAVFSYGFRPFFLFGAVWAAIAVALWLPILSGHLSLPSTLAPIEWHTHELIFGYVPAIVAGFLLTAVPNWTGRLPIVGTRLALLFVVWCAGRMAIFFSQLLGAWPAAAVDMAFLAFLGGVIAREIIASGNTSNLKVLAGVTLLLIGNGWFHLEANEGLGSGHGTRLGIGATILLIMLIGGRISPSFTHNWLARRHTGRLPAPFDRFDALVMIVSGTALAGWVGAPHATTTAILALSAGLLNGARLARWSGERTVAEPLVLILHVAYAFVPIGFFLLALGIVRPDIVAPTGALHGWTAGAIGNMTLAVMTRASLGHTGQPLTATCQIEFIYFAAIAAVLARIAAAFDLVREPMLHLSATAWVAAFGGFVVVFGPLLLRRRA